jgi:hypothetical protein
MKRVLLFLCVVVAAVAVDGTGCVEPLEPDPNLQALAKEFFAWRAVTQPCTPDDIPRVERPAGWIPQVAPESLAAQQRRYTQFRERLERLSRRGRTRRDSVDYLLVRSAIERVRWELEILRVPFRNPDFYVQQTLGAVYELLVISSTMTDARMEEILLRLESIPGTLVHARLNLTEPVQPFARIALANLGDVGRRLDAMSAALRAQASPAYHQRLATACAAATAALDGFAIWLKDGLPRMSPGSPLGHERYEWFLKNVALNPISPEEMLVIGKREFDRAVACEALERNRGNPPLPLFRTIDEQNEQGRKDEKTIRRFLEERGLLTLPEWLGRYQTRLLPAHVEPLMDLGVPDDLTSESRLAENAYAYRPPPSAGLPFFHRACAQDPRPIIIHEGIPGHYFQMAVSWRNPDPIRRRYFDSGPNEGWAFYVEEMLLLSGLFDIDRPAGREIIYRFMRLRALRVEVDVRLALGQFSIEQAAEYLASSVPMDRETALGEAAFFAATPGQAITYQIGKSQILAFLQDARKQEGDRFSLRTFHDRLTMDGNVPVALVRWEWLGFDDEVRKLW